MDKLEVKYRSWYKGIAPGPIKLEIPGWSGESNDHGDGAKPQPWMCTPFVDGSTYGLELVYPFDTECRVTRKGDKIIFDGDFSKESAPWDGMVGEGIPKGAAPMISFAPGHFGMTTSLDIMPPEGYCLRVEPHPRFYTDRTGTCPCAIAGNIQRWWGRILFAAFKSPQEGEVVIFRKGEPYAHGLVIPNKPQVSVKPMTPEEAQERAKQEGLIGQHGSRIASNNWVDHKGQAFNDKYKMLTRAFAKGGEEEVKKVIEKAKEEAKKEEEEDKLASLEPKTKKRIPRRLIRREALSHKKENNKKARLHSGGRRAEEHLESIKPDDSQSNALERPFSSED